MNWLLAPFGLSGPGYTSPGSGSAFTYLWLPFMILPIYAGLERIPSSLLEASADLGGRSLGRSGRSSLPLAFPAVVAGLDLHVLAHARRLHPARALLERAVHRHRHLLGRGRQLPLAAAFAMVRLRS